MPDVLSSTPPAPEPVAPTLRHLDEPSGDGAAERCPCCEAPRTGPYCQGCGQHYLDGPITLRLLGRQFAQRFLKLEEGLLGTHLALWRRPGAVAREFVGGRRRPYVNPLSYVFLGAAASLLVLPLVIGDGDGNLSESMEMGIAMAKAIQSDKLEAMTPERRAAIEETIDRVMPVYAEKLGETMRQLSSLLALVFGLVLAAFFRLFFGGQRYTYAEQAVPALYVTGHYYLLTVPLALATLWMPGGIWVYTAGGALVFGVLVVATATGFYGRSWGTAGLAAVSFAGTYIVFSTVVMMAAAFIAMWRARPEIDAIAESVRAAHGL